MARIALVSVVFMAAPPSEIEFNCPWCSTKLALPRSDFERERAVLCPRCSNPIDLEIQRRLARTPTPAALPPPAVAPPRRQVTVTKPARKEKPAPQAPPVPPPPPPAPPAQHPSAHAPPPAVPKSIDASLDWPNPLDMDTSFGSLPTRSPEGRLSSTEGAMQGVLGAKIKCPACAYENVKVPPEFSFGTIQKCSWCSKPLPVV